jgi:hypothetical protein
MNGSVTKNQLLEHKHLEFKQNISPEQNSSVTVDTVILNAAKKASWQ